MKQKIARTARLNTIAHQIQQLDDKEARERENGAVLHAVLSDTERVQLVARFNNLADNLLVLVIMHSVSSQGVNLDSCCCRVQVVTNAANAPNEWQSWGRVIRVFALRVRLILVWYGG